MHETPVTTSATQPTTAPEQASGDDALAEARAREQSIALVRWVGVAFAVLQVALWEPEARAVGSALTVGLAAANVLIARANARIAGGRMRDALGLAALALDTGVLVGFTYLYAYQEHGSTWLILYLAPLEAALRYGLRGALATAAAISLLYLPREAYRYAAFGYPMSWPSVSFRLGVLWIIALFAGLLAHRLLQERDAARRLAAERAELLRQVQAAERLKAAFVWSVAHDLRPPLALLVGHAKLLQLQRAELSRHDWETSLRSIEEAVWQLKRRVRALLEFASVEEDPSPPRPRPVALAALAGEVVDLLAAEARRLGVAVTFEAERGLATVGDAAALRAALVYLLEDALRCVAPGGRVAVRAGRAPVGAVIEMATSGSARPGEGHGLGALLAGRIVQAHGGWMEGDGGAHGARPLRLVLPPPPQPPVAAGEPASTGAEGNG